MDEIVVDGSTTSPAPAVGVGDFLLPEREYLKKVAAAIEEVVRRTERSEYGVTYSVVMMLSSTEGWSDQDNPHEHEVWSRFVRFGTSEASQAGGHLFRVASQDQEAIGAFVWRAMDAADQA